ASAVGGRGGGGGRVQGGGQGVEGQVGEVGGQLLPSQAGRPCAVCDHERHAALAQKAVGLVGEPGLVPKLERVPEVARERGQRLREAFVVAWEIRRGRPQPPAPLRRG